MSATDLPAGLSQEQYKKITRAAFKAAGGKGKLSWGGKKTATKKKGGRKGYRKYSGGGYGGKSRYNIIQGLGAYSAPKSAAFGRNLGAGIGGLLPGPWKLLGGPLGAVGGWLGNKVGTILGLGEYEVSQNSIIHEGQTPPMMHRSEDTIVVRHREYMGDIYSGVGGAFRVQSFQLQPGLSSTFEWLAPIAGQYQEWIPHGMVMEFKSNSGDVVSGTSSELGMVIMATDYNAFGQNPFQNKTQMLNTVYSTNAKITDSFYHPIECAPHRNVMDMLFVRTGAIPANQPPQLYDLGTFAIASQGCQGDNQNLGELWMTYEIGLSKASLIQTGNAAQPCDIFYGFNIAAGSNATTPLTGFEPNAGNSLGFSLGPGGQQVLFPPNLEQGSYICTLYYSNAASGVPVSITVTNLVGCAAWPLFDGASKLDGDITAPAEFTCNATFAIQIVGGAAAQPSFNVFWTSGPSGGSGTGYLMIHQVPSGLVPMAQ